jgi:tetratricopeptide (TPR) repeat protein
MRRRGLLLSRSFAVVLLLRAAAPLEARAQVPPSVPGSAPGDPEWLARATTLVAHGRIDEAVAMARQLPEGDRSAPVVLARSALREGRILDAEGLLKSVVEQEPAGDAALDLGFLYRSRGRDEAAASLFDAVATSNANAQEVGALLRAARATAALGEFRQANQLFRRASRAAGGDPAVETAWGELFLDKHNTQDAARSFEEALKADPQWAPAHLGLAQALADTNPPAAAEALGRAVAIDPGLTEAHVLSAQLQIDAGHRAEARTILATAVQRNPTHPEARALLAAIDRVEDRGADFDAQVARLLADNPRYAGAYDTAADLLARSYRFEEAVALGRKAAQVNPADAAVLAHLGLNLMRTGEEVEARQALDAAFRIDPYDVVTYNLLTLLDTLDEFDTVEDAPFVFRFHKGESPVLREYAPALAKDALAALTKRYGFTPRGPILVEMFPRHDDFAVRTLGLPGLIGALGACFGRVVTLDSPKARPPNTFSWQSTLWHELAHVITLQMSRQRVPRWLTEGISVYEEGRARPEWGREMEVTFARAWSNGKVIPVRELDSGFTKPDTIALAYYEASLLVDHLVRLRGDAGLVALLAAYGDGLENEAALQRAFGLSLESLQAGFDLSLKARFDTLARVLRDVPDLKGASSVDALSALALREPDSFAVQLQLGRALAAADNRAAAIAAYERAATLVPQATGPDSPRAQLAALAEAQQDHARAIQELQALIAVDHTNVDAARQLLTIAERAGDGAASARAAARIVALDPFDSTAHTALGRAALAEGDHGAAAREFRVALSTGPADAAAAHCDLGEAYFAAGKPADAKREALASLEVAPLFERAQELLLKAVEARR